MKKLLIGLGISIFVVGLVAGLYIYNNVSNIGALNKNFNDEITNIEEAEKISIENNGTEHVYYNGKIYYREYSDDDFEAGGLSTKYGLKGKNKKAVKSIDDNNKINFEFFDTGIGAFYILNDKFFGALDDGSLYISDLTGNVLKKIGVGRYLGCNEEDRKMYYAIEDTIYSFDTEKMESSTIGTFKETIYNIFTVCGEKIYYFDLAGSDFIISYINSENGNKVKVATIPIDMDKIENEGLLLGATRVEESYICDDKLVLSIGTISDGTLHFKYILGSYVIDINADKLITDKDLNVIEYNKTQAQKKSIMTQHFNEKNILDKYGFYHDYCSGYKWVESKFNYAINNKIIYTIIVSIENSEYSIGWRDGHERLVIEVHMIDEGTNKDIVLYSVKSKNMNLALNKYFKEKFSNCKTMIEYDDLLNEIYKYLKQNMTEKEFDKLKQDEREWIKIKDKLEEDKRIVSTRIRCGFLISLMDDMKFRNAENLNNITKLSDVFRKDDSCLDMLAVYTYNACIEKGYADDFMTFDDIKRSLNNFYINSANNPVVMIYRQYEKNIEIEIPLNLFEKEVILKSRYTSHPNSGFGTTLGDNNTIVEGDECSIKKGTYIINSNHELIAIYTKKEEYNWNTDEFDVVEELHDEVKYYYIDKDTLYVVDKSYNNYIYKVFSTDKWDIIYNH